MTTVWTWFLNALSSLFNSLDDMIIINNLSINALIIINIVSIILLATFRRLTHAK